MDPLPGPKHFNLTFPHDYVAHIEINHPEKLNSFHEPMWLELHSLFTTLSHSSEVRAIVFSGAGPKAFTAGLDVKAAVASGQISGRGGVDPARTAVSIRRHILEFQDCVSSIEKCEKPVIVVMHGYTFGLGIDLATAADVRICSQDVKFSVREVDIGLAADVGTLTRLPKVVGNFSWVKDVAMTARIFGAEEALRVGFVSDVQGDKGAAVKKGVELAALMASKSPVAVQGTKELLNFSRDHNLATGLRYTSVWNSAAVQCKDVEEAMLSGVQKRKVTFEKL